MRAFKGFNKKLTSVMGDGKEENCVFEVGKTKTVEDSKTARSGFHCCENPFECIAYYPLGGDNRYFVVEAAGDINEDDSERIACTRITIVEELDEIGLAYEGMKYMIKHPERQNWRQNRPHLEVAMDKARAMYPGDIAIARGKNPKVKGVEGSILGLLIEEEESDRIASCKLILMDEVMSNHWIRWNVVTEDLEVCDEEESD